MTWPSVTINQQNQRQGTIDEIERNLLYVGFSQGGRRDIAYLSAETDIATTLSSASAKFLSVLLAAQLNGGQNWQAMAMTYPEQGDGTFDQWIAGIEAANEIASFEGVIAATELYDITAGRTAIGLFSALRDKFISQYGRWMWFALSVAAPEDSLISGPDDLPGGTWEAYIAFLSELQDGIDASAVQLVPMLYGNELGALGGRLCDRSVTIADSPARVKTGSLLGLPDSASLDSEGDSLTLAHLRAMHDLRYSVPMWYADYEGLYWSDGLTLDVTGGDYPVIEYVRIVDKVARRVRIQAIAKIADRSLNSTPASIAAHKTYFSKTMRDMSKSAQINGVTFPGEVKPPQVDDVEIVWSDSKTVAIYIVVRPYASPKAITVSIMLDDTLENE